MSDPAVVTEGLVKRFGGHTAVADLSLTVPRGEIFGFLGPNGAGKTTSVKLLLGLVARSGGAGTVLGAPIGHRATRARIGFLPEHFHFHSCLTGRELLRLHGRLYGLRGADLERRIDALLCRMDLVEAADRRLQGYSKGMLQRAGLAQALLNDPELVFLDEPTSGLDPLGRLLVRDILRELRDAGTTVFLNSHLLGEVEATCDRVVFIKAGRVVSELRLGRDEAGTEIVLRIGRADAGVLDALGRFGSGVSCADGHVRLRARDELVAPLLARWLVAQGIDIFELRLERRSLERIFLDVMGEDARPG
ncbi:MAG: ABC transporter ATP-binding protein [Betaproteobacteria bacterium]